MTPSSPALIGRAPERRAIWTAVLPGSSAAEAIKLLEQRAASVLLADWLMPDIADRTSRHGASV
jgi:hypothetical protein